MHRVLLMRFFFDKGFHFHGHFIHDVNDGTSLGFHPFEAKETKQPWYILKSSLKDAKDSTQGQQMECARRALLVCL